MRADRDDIRLAPERRAGNYTMIIAGGSVLVLAILLYIGLRDSDAPEAPTAPAVVRDSAIVAPPVVDTATPDPAQQQAAPGANTGTAATPRDDFNERQLAPPTSTVGAGAAPASGSANAERLVIDGDLLQELEDDAESAGDAPRRISCARHSSLCKGHAKPPQKILEGFNPFVQQSRLQA